MKIVQEVIFVKDLKNRFVTAWLYGGWIFKILVVVAVLSGIFSVVYVNPVVPQPGWIAMLIYTISLISAVLYIFPEEW